MKYELEVLQTVTYETEKLQDILDKFYSECSWHLTVTVKDQHNNEAELNLEVNDMEANISIDWSEWTSYDEEDVLDMIAYEWLDINSLTLI